MNKYIEVSKEYFCKVIDALKTADTLIKDINKAIKKSDGDGYIWLNDKCALICIENLKTAFKDSDYVDFIEEFCYKYDFGKNVKPDTFKDNDGQYVDLSSAEKLFDFLMK